MCPNPCHRRWIEGRARTTAEDASIPPRTKDSTEDASACAKTAHANRLPDLPFYPVALLVCGENALIGEALASGVPQHFPVRCHHSSDTIWLGVLVSASVLGPRYCGWVCAWGSFQDFLAPWAARLRPAVARPARLLYGVRYGLLAGMAYLTLAQLLEDPPARLVMRLGEPPPLGGVTGPLALAVTALTIVMVRALGTRAWWPVHMPVRRSHRSRRPAVRPPRPLARGMCGLRHLQQGVPKRSQCGSPYPETGESLEP